eukprot:CAMPEP_0178950012 /NCGR_PEP_ID=MMETSP0789-20121207/6398_1 /TAXON_ID=3005 /ORGANISM="Rhizosolenia setigera, Strain CCMP 1694" /LENGTH=107 /DNA_ID=CAMNT_0020630655 /DNA_START=46 /DNA_END=369 /DNA_ORIENTATION=-
MSASSLYSFSYCETFGDDDENINNEDEYQKALSILQAFHQHDTETMMLSPCAERFCPLYVIYEDDCEEQEIESRTTSSACISTSLRKPRTVMDLTSLTALDDDQLYV